MKTLEEFGENIYKCTKCAQCQGVCPVYKTTGLESAVSRGKMVILNGVLNGDVEFSKKTASYFENCLMCGKCEEFCPSGVNIDEILTLAKHKALKNGHGSFFKKLFNSFLFSKNSQKVLKILINLYRGLKILDIVEFLNNKIFKFKFITFVNSVLKINFHYKKRKKNTSKRPKILYFEGCVNKYINPSVKNALMCVLDENDCEYEVLNLDCCGLPFKNSGDIEQYRKIAEENLSKIDEDVDYILVDCASCMFSLKKYGDYVGADLKEKAQKISEKIINIYDYFAQIKFKNFPKSDIGVTYHNPCHIKDNRNVLGFIKNNFSNYVEHKDFDVCCGGSGSFMFFERELSKKISSKKAENIINSDCEYVLTSCPSCVVSLNKALIDKGSKIRAIQPVELMARQICGEKDV